VKRVVEARSVPDSCSGTDSVIRSVVKARTLSDEDIRRFEVRLMAEPLVRSFRGYGWSPFGP
jgi:hypothetical protein